MGLAERPEQQEGLVCFSAEPSSGSGKTDVYLAREIWEEMCGESSHPPGIGRLEVLLPGYGRYWLRFELPADLA